jgi:Ser/Thr protein kinase RdoA (MazF antagonist)
VERAGDAWRVLTFVEGEIHERLLGTAHAREAGKLLGRFHRAIQDLDHRFRNKRLGVHDTRLHMKRLEGALAARSDHRLFFGVEPLAREVLARLLQLGELSDPPDRTVHGDPKVSNLVFSAAGLGRCLIDLDTLAKMPITLELGDAFRSWCNASGEDRSDVRFSLELFEAALEGYAEGAGGLLTEAERSGIVPATERIILELSARFLTDALEERYFGWDPARFPARGEHNELRARGQLALARSLGASKEAALDVAHRAFGP